MKRCPNCGCTRFYVIAHVTQGWEVNKNGDWLMTIDNCIDITHRPDNYDLWECLECAYKANGFEFEVEE